MERQVKYVTSEGCGLKMQGHFQVPNIINSDWIGDDFQVEYSYETFIRCVCVSDDTTVQTGGLVCTENR
jgi:hypothetical protein